MIRAVLFDVDFTLIYPGPTFGPDGYAAFAARHGMSINPGAYQQAVASSAQVLDDSDDVAYDSELFIKYARSIVQHMGGRGEGLDSCAREIYDEWARCHHFELYDDVPDVLRALVTEGIRIGLVSNSHRCLKSFQSHFELHGLITSAVSSAEHGVLKPHPSIFQAALEGLGVPAGNAAMVGDSVSQDVEGALRVGMRAVLLHRGEEHHPRRDELETAGIPVIGSLRELPARLFAIANLA